MKQCFKKYKKLKTQCNLLRDDVFPYFSIRVVSEKTFLQMSDYFYFIYGDAVFIVSKKCICVKQLSVCLLYGGKADAHLKSLHTYSLCYNRETSKANTDVQTFIRDAKLLCQVGVISKDRYKINDLFHNRKEDEFMKTKVFIDGSAGTTGLRIDERFANRDDVEILKIDPEKRKDVEERKKMINASDITFLCLPDAASRESVSLVENDQVCIIDTSTAHRTEAGWAYGFPELSKEHREKIKTGKRIAVPGCHATGFISVVYPLVANGILPKDYPVSSFSLSGYSGAGKNTIAAYQSLDRPEAFSSGREYALTQQHKHLKEMKAITGIDRLPLFSPIIDDYYSGMVVSVPLYTDMLKAGSTVETVRDCLAKHYEGEPFIQVCPLDNEVSESGFLPGNGLSGWDGLKIYVTGNEDRIVVSSQFDNLGKGASGAAIQCMNIVLGYDESKGLNL